MVIKNNLKITDIKALTFDIDRTITEWTSVPAFLASVLNEYGLNFNDEVMQQFFRAVKYFDMHLVTTSECSEAVYGECLGESIEILKQNGISGNDFRKRMFLKEADFTKAEDDIQNSIARLYESYDLYCYTNWFYKQALKKLNKYDLAKFFKGIYAYDNNYIKFTKLGFLKILSDLSLGKENVIHIGDSKADIIPARNAGLQSILIDYNACKQDLYDKADSVVTEFRDIPIILERKL